MVKWIASKDLSKAEFRWFNIYSLTEWGSMLFKKPNCLLYNRKNIFVVYIFQSVKAARRGMMRFGKRNMNNCIVQTVLSLSFYPFSFSLTFAGEFLKLKTSFSCKRPYLPALPTTSILQNAQIVHKAQGPF